ncbi:MAG: hypothetical protein HYT82_02925, partial [Candidatus Harrisonbacteria bacterium]|nr:hypothetical protein [Candidatus Harrisonbacteria bacterium]
TGIMLSLALLQEHPLRAVRETLPYYFHGAFLLTLVMRVIWFALLISAAVGAWELSRQDDRQKRMYAVFFGALIAFFTLMTLPIGAAIDARMRMAFEPIYFIFVAAGLEFIWRKAIWRDTFINTVAERE